MRITIALIGSGYWGKNYLKHLISNNDKFEFIGLVEKNESYADLLCIIPLQLLAFKLSLYKGCNVDMPRNLAKVVTVE